MDRLISTIQSSVERKNVKDFSCSECGDFFATSEKCKYHIEKYHQGNGITVTETEEDIDGEKGGENIGHICELCDRVFST